MKAYLQRGYTSRRVPDGPLMLAPPLSYAWALRQDAWSVRAVSEGIVVVQYGHGRLMAVDAYGRVLWKAARDFVDVAVVPSGLLGDLRGPTMQILDMRTGTVRLEVKTGANIEAIAPGANGVVASSVQGDWLMMLDSETLATRWKRQVASRPKRSGEVGCTERLVLVYTVEADAQVGRMRALDLGTGEEVWRARVDGVAALSSHLGMFPRLRLAVPKSRVVIDTDDGTAAYDVDTGTLAWRVPMRGHWAAYGDNVYLCHRRHYSDTPTEIVVLSIEDGHEVWKREYPEILSDYAGSQLASQPGVTDTHIFIGDALGTLWAFDVNTGEPVWRHRPKGIKGLGGYLGTAIPVIVENRLYIPVAGSPDHVLCYEQAGTGGVHTDSGIAVAGEDGQLRFEVLEVLKQQSMTTRAPYHASGGEWTALRCRCGEANFFVAARGEGKGALSWGEGRIWVPAAADGDGLLRAVRQAFEGRRTRPKRAQGVQPPTSLGVAFLGTGVDEAGTGEGGWTHSKWSGEQGWPEFYVRWSEQEKAGVIAEKDEAYRKGVVELFASLVVRS